VSSDITLEPATFYAVTAKDDTTDCPNFGQLLDVPELYSNAGHDAAVICGLCHAQLRIVSATRLDPQPEMP
jgi:hypothetical protein